MSFGVAELGSTDTAESLIHRADGAMYATKKNRRTC
jgi:PleD family two-component response regulator